MIEATGNLWEYPATWRIITTNGIVRCDGCAVMGRGCAREATKRYPALARHLGDRLTRNGNHVTAFPIMALMTFPVKHHWREVADLDLIARSVQELSQLLRQDQTYVMPRPGCGNGQRLWEEVRPLLVSLPDTVTIITFPETTP